MAPVVPKMLHVELYQIVDSHLKTCVPDYIKTCVPDYIRRKNSSTLTLFVWLNYETCISDNVNFVAEFYIGRIRHTLSVVWTICIQTCPFIYKTKMNLQVSVSFTSEKK